MKKTYPPTDPYRRLERLMARLRAPGGRDRMADRRPGRDQARCSAGRAGGGRGHLSGRLGKPAENTGVRAGTRARH